MINLLDMIDYYFFINKIVRLKFLHCG